MESIVTVTARRTTKGCKFPRMTVYTWNQNCVMAGRICHADRNGEVPTGDVTAHRGTRRSLERTARKMMKVCSGYNYQVWKSIFEEVC